MSIIWDLITGFLPDVWPYIVGALAIAGAWLTGRSSGAAKAKAKSDAAALKKTVKGAEDARKGRAEATAYLAKGMTPEEIRRKNDGKW